MRKSPKKILKQETKRRSNKRFLKEEFTESEKDILKYSYAEHNDLFRLSPIGLAIVVIVAFLIGRRCSLVLNTLFVLLTLFILRQSVSGHYWYLTPNNKVRDILLRLKVLERKKIILVPPKEPKSSFTFPIDVLNTFISSLWKKYEPLISIQVMDTVNNILLSTLSNKVQLSKFTLGLPPLKFTSLKSKLRGRDLNLRVGIQLNSNNLTEVALLLGGITLPIQISNLSFECECEIEVEIPALFNSVDLKGFNTYCEIFTPEKESDILGSTQLIIFVLWGV